MLRYFITGLFLASAVGAHEYRTGAFTIDHPFAFAATGASAEGFVIIVNQGPADRLIGVTSDYATTLVANGPVAAIDIPAAGAAELIPGGAHILFDGLTEEWRAGDQIPATLIFERAGEVRVVFYVEAK
ncbi:MAG: copper chaperone PCu(A)C [Pseudomonadota bacterium]